MHIDESALGVKFDITGKELVEHCKQRAAYHDNRRVFYEGEEKRFATEVDELAKEEAKGYSNTTTLSNKQRMEQSKNHHADRSKFFKFAAEHLREKSYKLSQSELGTFELIPR
jgi:hypothetical protein